MYRGRALTLKVMTLEARGRALEIEIVEHRGAAVVMPLLNASHVVLVRQRRHTIGEELLEFPAGTIEPGERPEECAARELEEETGYRASSLELLASFYASPGYSTEVLYAFLATGLARTEARPEADEEISVEIVPLKELVEMVRSNVIKDAKTIATLALYLLKQGKGLTI